MTLVRVLALVLLAAGLGGCGSTALPDLKFLSNYAALDSASLPPDSWIMHSIVMYGSQISESVLWPYAGRAACGDGMKQSMEAVAQLGGKSLLHTCRPIGRGI